MATAAMTRVGMELKGAAKEVVSDLKGKLAEKSKQARELANELADNSETIDRLFKTLPKVVGKNASTAALGAAAYGAGYLTDYLEEKNASKIGPLDAVSTVGVGVAVVSATFIDNPDLAEVGLAVGRGLFAGKLFEMGRDKRKKDKAKAGASVAAEKDAKK